MLQLSENYFKLTPGESYLTPAGQTAICTHKISKYGSGKKTVYSVAIPETGAEYINKDILYYKKLWGISVHGSAHNKRHNTTTDTTDTTETAENTTPVIETATGTNVIRHDKFAYLCELVKAGIAPYLYGPAGSGKNVTCQQIAEALGLDFYYSNSVTQEFKVAGFVDAAGNYHDTEFYRAFVNGGLFMLDELDASIPEVLTLLNAALANKYFAFDKIGLVKAHPDFRAIAAGNTFGLGANDAYTGRQVIDAATLNRFLTVKIDYCPAVEESISKDDPEALDFVRNLRKAALSVDTVIILGYRNIINLIKVSKLAAAGFVSLDEVVYSACLPGQSLDSLHTLCRAYVGDTNNRYYRALKSINTDF